MTLLELDKKRIARELTFRALATTVGVSSGFLCDLFFGRRKTSPEISAKLAKALGVDLAVAEDAFCRQICPQCGSHFTPPAR